jgi:hypothetical protein
MPLPIPGESGIPKNAIVHGECGSWWTGAERAHCSGCHLTLSGMTAFVRHRRGLRCNPPAEIGLVPREKPYGVLWGMPAPENGFNFAFADRNDDTEEAA